MEYAANAINQGYSATSGGTQTAMPPKTINSAASSIDELNSRLSKASEALSMISSQLGALTGVLGKAAGRDTPEPGGAVHRLNRSAEQAHLTVGEIENLIAGIGRALG